MSPHVRKVRTASGAIAVQVVTKRGGRRVHIEHIGSAHDAAELAALEAAARVRLAAPIPGQGLLDIDLPERGAVRGGPDRVLASTDQDEAVSGEGAVQLGLDLPNLELLERAGRRPAGWAALAQGPRQDDGPLRDRQGRGVSTGCSCRLLIQVLQHAWRVLGLDTATGGDRGSPQMCLARLVEPTSKTQVPALIADLGIAPVSRHSLFRSLSKAAQDDYRAQVQRALHAQATAGMKGYVTNLPATRMDATEVIRSYHALWHVEQSFRMSKTDLKARPVFHHSEQAIEAHLTIVIAALAISRYLTGATGMSIKTIARTLRPLRQITIRVGPHDITAHPQLTDQSRTILTALNIPEPGH